MVECEFVGEAVFEGFSGKKCKLDQGYCCHFADGDLVKVCPTKKQFLASGVSPSSSPDLGYKGVPKCFRSGQFGTFDGGMPPEYMRKKV
jgi:hypothetical protein